MEPFLRWLIVGSRGYVPGPTPTHHKDHFPTEAYPGHGFTDDHSFATCTLANLKIQLRKLSLFTAYTCLEVNAKKCSTTGALLRKGNTITSANTTHMLHQLTTLTIEVKQVRTLLSPLSPSSPIKY
jgi:hypothetical protein